MNIERIMSSLEAKHPGESEYLQAVKEVLLSIEDIYNQHPEFEKAKIENESFKVINKRKKHYIEYKFNVRNRNDVFNFYVEVYGNGKCSVNVTSNNRASISYGGDLTPIPDDKRKALGI